MRIYCGEKCRQARTETTLTKHMVGERGKETRIVWCARHKKCAICFGTMVKEEDVIGTANLILKIINEEH